MLLTTAPLGAQVQLKAERATAKQVEFSWTGGAGHECRLERKAGASGWALVAASSEGKATDAKVDAFGTYNYRVGCAGQTSREITVGPPPAGFHLIAPKPEKHQDTAFGRLISLTLNANGDPAVAFVYMDPNGDGNYADSQLMFVTWDRAVYRWRDPVVVGVVGNYDPRPPVVGVSLARDPDTDAYGVVWADTDNHGINLAVSHDGGATWTVRKAITDSRSMGGASLALAGGKAHLILAQDAKNAIRYATGGLDEEPANWQVSYAPMLPGTNAVGRGSALALDSAGMPAVAYWQRPATGNVWTLALWRPGNDTPTRITDNGDSGYPPEGVVMAFAGTQPAVVIDSRLHRAQVAEHYALFSKDQGATWSQPSPIPDDGNEHILGFMSLAIGPDGKAVLAGDVIGGNTQHMRCSWPKLSRTSDFTSWTTCSPQGGLRPDARTLWGSVVFSPNGTLHVVFQNHQFSPAQPLPPGLMIWTGR